MTYRVEAERWCRHRRCGAKVPVGRYVSCMDLDYCSSRCFMRDMERLAEEWAMADESAPSVCLDDEAQD